MEAKEFIDKNFSGKADNFQITRYMFEDCLTRFANSNDKIKVAEDGVTVLDEPKPYLFETTAIDEETYEKLRSFWNKAESITIKEHNKRLMYKLECSDSALKMCGELKRQANKELKQCEHHKLQAISDYNEANETITTYKNAIKELMDVCDKHEKGDDYAIATDSVRAIIDIGLSSLETK